MSGWVFVTKQLLGNENEAMLVPAIFNCTNRTKRKPKTERMLCIASDILYYTIRYVILKTAFNT